MKILYWYSCPECGNTDNNFNTKLDFPETIPCPKCLHIGLVFVEGKEEKK